MQVDTNVDESDVGTDDNHWEGEKVDIEVNECEMGSRGC
jgi:hypothetical protein